MRTLVPQLPGRLRRRLGFEAGLSAGVVSAKAALPSESQPSSVALLDAVVEMIEREKGSRWRTENDLFAGDWIQFEEEFRYGDAAAARYSDSEQDAAHALAGLVCFAATDAEPPFVLCGSAVHVLDRWQTGASPEKRVGWFYMDALAAYARTLAELPDEAATARFEPPTTTRRPEEETHLRGKLAELAGEDTITIGEVQPSPQRHGLEGSLAYTLQFLCFSAQSGGDDYDQWATEPVRLSGHARVLAAVPTGSDGPPGVLATPLYVEYAQD
ncbi:SAVMC3_10250 family protein [Amycolatopsis rhizosphaerae]|uniref:SAVMC3_10250 family protein n=1 Tax=Amycolatopsis rhizosphaerae TaxID=2053003 RepID=UPI002482BFFD|nr:SAVMC3_10250 family protein [Amycolatopsis rhizosphaerae]